jgi:hypothetical protein
VSIGAIIMAIKKLSLATKKDDGSNRGIPIETNQ